LKCRQRAAAQAEGGAEGDRADPEQGRDILAMMSTAEPTRRIVYEASIDDVVDVALRVAMRQRAFRRQVLLTAVFVGILSGLAAAWLSSRFGGLGYASAAPLGAVFGLVVAVVFRPIFVREIRSQHRKLVAEPFAGRSSLPCELELRAGGVWVRQDGVELAFPWARCTEIVDGPNDIEIVFAPGGLCVVKNRHFRSREERTDFLVSARQLAQLRA
jgi:hypothetical protein